MDTHNVTCFVIVGDTSEREVNKFFGQDPWSTKTNVIGGDLCDLIPDGEGVHDGKIEVSFKVKTRMRVEDEEHLSSLVDDTLYYYGYRVDWDDHHHLELDPETLTQEESYKRFFG